MYYVLCGNLYVLSILLSIYLLNNYNIVITTWYILQIPEVLRFPKLTVIVRMLSTFLSEKIFREICR